MNSSLYVIGNKFVNIIYSNLSLNIWIKHKKKNLSEPMYKEERSRKGIGEWENSWNICLEQRKGSFYFINLKCMSSLPQCFTVIPYSVLFSFTPYSHNERLHTRLSYINLAGG